MATVEELEALKQRQASVRKGVRAFHQRHKEAGLCWHCFAPSEAGKTSCARHLAINLELTRAYKEQLARDEAALRMRPYSLPVRSA